MMNELHLPWVPNFIALGIYFLFGTKFSWKEEIYTCFNVGCVLLGRNFDFLGSYLVVSARYLMIATGYCSLPIGYCSLLVVTARYRSLLLVPTLNMNGFCFTFYLGLPSNPTTQTLSAPESISGSKGLPSFDTLGIIRIFFSNSMIQLRFSIQVLKKNLIQRAIMVILLHQDLQKYKLLLKSEEALLKKK